MSIIFVCAAVKRSDMYSGQVRTKLKIPKRKVVLVRPTFKSLTTREFADMGNTSSNPAGDIPSGNTRAIAPDERPLHQVILLGYD